MKIYGMNSNVCKGLYVVYTCFKGRRYFFGAYKTEVKAQEVANKWEGNYIYI